MFAGETKNVEADFNLDYDLLTPSRWWFVSKYLFTHVVTLWNLLANSNEGISFTIFSGCGDTKRTFRRPQYIYISMSTIKDKETIIIM